MNIGSAHRDGDSQQFVGEAHHRSLRWVGGSVGTFNDEFAFYLRIVTVASAHFGGGSFNCCGCSGRFIENSGIEAGDISRLSHAQSQQSVSEFFALSPRFSSMSQGFAGEKSGAVKGAGEMFVGHDSGKTKSSFGYERGNKAARRTERRFISFV
jgi:hypothetical protein